MAEPPADNGSRKGSKRAPKPKVEYVFIYFPYIRSLTPFIRAKSDPAGRIRAAKPKVGL